MPCVTAHTLVKRIKRLAVMEKILNRVLRYIKSKDIYYGFALVLLVALLCVILPDVFNALESSNP